MENMGYNEKDIEEMKVRMKELGAQMIHLMVEKDFTPPMMYYLAIKLVATTRIALVSMINPEGVNDFLQIEKKMIDADLKETFEMMGLKPPAPTDTDESYVR